MFQVNNAVASYRRGGFVIIEGGRDVALAQSAECATEESIERLERWSGTGASLALTVVRAQVLHSDTNTAEVVSLRLDATVPFAAMQALVDPCVATSSALARSPAFEPVDEDSSSFAAVRLSKIARLLPAAVCVPYSTTKFAELQGSAANREMARVDARAIAEYERLSATTLRRVSEARVPIEAVDDARLVAYRPADGSAEHYAIIIGDPASHQPVLCRLHSECFTGDLLGSLRCDCGPQLKRALEQIGIEGHGVVLYLSQEGRGIGLANKLRAYQLQDRGIDTLDANRHLGFDVDERSFKVAAVMLGDLGISRVRLMTNNPDKIRALEAEGVAVSARVPHAIRANGHNHGYLSTKAQRAGHLFDIEP